jgi:hypothetical protein
MSPLGAPIPDPYQFLSCHARRLVDATHDGHRWINYRTTCMSAYLMLARSQGAVQERVSLIPNTLGRTRPPDEAIRAAQAWRQRNLVGSPIE